MARQTRAERRARRQQASQAEPALAGAGGGRGAKPPVRLAPEPPSRPERTPRTGAEEGRGFFLGGLRRFIVESWGELRKVEWPSQSHVIQGTVVVLIACIIIGTYIWLNDIAWKHVVQDVLLR
jgi:preprotein translocase subunit SecE